ncbi:type II toxin-antitoxin system VapC family toxin [Acaryochloris marina]|uniref:PIN domain protein n=1 Tax=Acaryochloris marina (strain MBIC 11017) TaxID=329726 RepID=A8ZPC0_ACAM1|nr:type II toxin-antitoxin system VapC family toxin [Acaryochloris marina]ABW32856.1 PIN domain protein [Acaryochloris marina MBIC11017]BDM83749.1 twitching motility protein PilT [Acaryochloris marina MBIC10699]
MFLLDTNVISELRKVASRKANKQVEIWATSTPGEQTYISAISVFEIERGVLLTERRDKKQGQVLRLWLTDHVLNNYAERIIPISTSIAIRTAQLHVPDPMPAYDALIAATALEHGLTLVTRNTNDFQGTGVKLLNPWI